MFIIKSAAISAFISEEGSYCKYGNFINKMPPTSAYVAYILCYMVFII